MKLVILDRDGLDGAVAEHGSAPADARCLGTGPGDAGARCP